VTLLKPLLSIAALAGITLAATAPAVATPQRELREIRCDLLEQQRGQLLTVEATDLHVLAQTANGQRFAPAIPQGMAGISCGRTSIIPAAWDDQVLALGLPLFIAETGTIGRVGVLEIDNGRYRFRLIRGEMQPEEQAQIDARIQAYQARFDAAQRRTRQQ
jgi:hypothetical protein